MDRKAPRKKAPGQAEDTERTEVVPEAPPPEPARTAPPAAPAPRVELSRRPIPTVTPSRPAPLPGRAPAAPASPRSFFSPIIEVGADEEVEHRHFPRARLATNFELWIDEGGDRRFTATLRSANVSVGGAFLESSFFLPMDTELRVRFSLEEGAAPVEARARIVREQRPRREDDPTGFGIRFEEFYGQTEVSLARLFLDMRLRTFAEEYLRSNRARGLPNELERVVDALAAWELLKANNPTDTWRGE
ncbi:MAG TPA: PilZ domain-containing protein [Archangium sp.]|nr:PilZ domain-containing protein [Archangium sp.]